MGRNSPQAPRKKVVREVWPPIRWVESRNRYMVDLRTGLKGEGKREFFRTREEAETVARAAADKRQIQGDSAYRNDELAAMGYTVQEAVRFFIRHIKAQESSKPVVEVIDALLALRKQEGRSDRYLGSLRNELRRFDAFIDGRQTIREITLEQLNEYLQTAKTAGTRNTRRKHIVTLFNFAVEHNWLEVNVAEKTKRLEEDYDVQTLKPEQMRRLLAACDVLSEPAADAMRAYIALAGFAGIRPEELHRLDWRDVDLEEGNVYIHKRVSKVKEDRNILLEPNCVEWLSAMPVRRGVVAPKEGFRYRFDAVRIAAGFSVRGSEGDDWPNDVLRHSYASHWLAIHNNRPMLAELMGNSVDVIGKHYRRPVSKALAEEWFAIYPEAAESKVIQIA